MLLLLIVHVWTNVLLGEGVGQTAGSMPSKWLKFTSDGQVAILTSTGSCEQHVGHYG